MAQSTGKHVIIDFYSCYEKNLSTKDSLTEIIKKALEKINFNPDHTIYEEYPEEKVFVLLSSNCHITIHVHQQTSYVAIDMYTFKRTFNSSTFMKVLKKSFGAEQVKMTSVNRADNGKLMDMKPRSKTKTTAKARVKQTSNKMKNASSKMFNIITRKK